MSLSVTRPERTVQFCTNLNLKSAHEDAERALADAHRAALGDARETGSVTVREAAERVRVIEEQMREHTVVFTLRGWPRKRWAEFSEQHPARKDNEGDRQFDVDTSALDEAISGVMCKTCREAGLSPWPRTIVHVRSLDGADIEFDPADFPALADEMTTAQWSEFARAVLEANLGVRSAPFSVAASRAIRTSEPSSN